jgi:hypothetical protein
VSHLFLLLQFCFFPSSVCIFPLPNSGRSSAPTPSVTSGSFCFRDLSSGYHRPRGTETFIYSQHFSVRTEQNYIFYISFTLTRTKINALRKSVSKIRKQIKAVRNTSFSSNLL